MHFCVVSLVQAVQICTKLCFDMYTQKLIEKMHMCNADDAKLNFTT